jgi:hypothetical protein
MHSNRLLATLLLWFTLQMLPVAARGEKPDDFPKPATNSADEPFVKSFSLYTGLFQKHQESLLYLRKALLRQQRSDWIECTCLGLRRIDKVSTLSIYGVRAFSAAPTVAFVTRV